MIDQRKEISVHRNRKRGSYDKCLDQREQETQKRAGRTAKNAEGDRDVFGRYLLFLRGGGDRCLLLL